MSNISINMICASLAHFPEFTLPTGYRFRPYQAGDDVTWQVLQKATEPFITITDDYFERQFGDALDALPDRMFFVEAENGEAVGTITAWWDRDRFTPNERGRIHWVAVHPQHQRMGISKPMMTHAMHRLAQSHQAAVLGTSSGRPWAVKVYLDFGFVPYPEELADPQIYAAWQEVQTLIQHPLLARVLHIA